MLFISHGGGPMPLLGDPGRREMVDRLTELADRLPKPSAILVISAHWEESVPTVTSGANPQLIYDYHGFSPEAYTIVNKEFADILLKHVFGGTFLYDARMPLNFSLIPISPLVMLLAQTLTGTAHADTFNFSWDNDLLLGLDQGYTNGVRLAYLTSPSEDEKSGSARFSRAAGDWFDVFPGVSPPSQNQAVSFSLRQLMVTPADISREEPSRNDLPYAGYLSLSSTIWSWDADTITGYGAHLGVVGPESGAEASQKWVHKVTGSEKPRGWDHQLGTDLVGGLQATHARKLWQSGSKGELEHELAWVGSGMVSSFRTHARLGGIWRTGRYLPGNFVPDYAGTASTVGLPSALNRVGEGWSVFIGIGVEYVPYSYLEDNAGPYQFEESLFLAQAGIGATWQWQNLQAAMIVRATTGEEETNKDSFSFGTLSVTWTY